MHISDVYFGCLLDLFLAYLSFLSADDVICFGIAVNNAHLLASDAHESQSMRDVSVEGRHFEQTL